MNEPLLLPLNAAIEILEALGLRYALVGGLAVSAWGALRTTRDIDLYADLPEGVRPLLKRELESRDFEVPAMSEELQQFGMFRSLFRPTRTFLDIFDAGTPLGEAILDRRREAMVIDRKMWTISPEDLALLKAFSDRERDFGDLTKLLGVLGKSLDIAYIEGWARELDRSIGGDEVSERLRRAREEASKRVRRKR